MASSTVSGGLSHEMLRSLKSSWWTGVAGVAIGLTLGVVLLEQFPTRYRAELVLPPIPAGSNGLALEGSTLRRLARRAHAEANAAFRASLDWQVDSQSGERRLTAVAADAARASTIVRHWARILDGPEAESSAAVTVASIDPPASVLFYLLGLAVGLLCFLGPPLVRGAIDPVIWEAASMRRLDAPMIACIPRISTPEVRAERSRRRMTNLALSGLALAVLAVVVLTQVN